MMEHLAYQLARAIVWVRIIALAARWPFRPCLGDLVKHDGRVWTLTQGVSDPIWTLRGPGEPREVHRDDFTKIKTLRNLMGSFRNGYRFYDSYWREIWVRKQYNRLVRVKGKQ